MLQALLWRLLRIVEHNIAEVHRDTEVARAPPAAKMRRHPIHNWQLFTTCQTWVLGY